MIDRKYMIININEVNKIDFSQIMQTSQETLRKSIDGTKVIIKWEDDEPSFTSSIVSKEGPYLYQEVLSILSTSEWSNNTNLDN